MSDRTNKFKLAATAIFIIFSFQSALLAQHTYRTFTGANGNKIQATVINVKGQNATIKIPNRQQPITLPFSKFSTEDQAYLKSWQPANSGSTNLSSNDWFQWRGPNRNGQSNETGLLTSWNEKPPLAWRTKGLGKGYSSIVISKGRIYTLGNIGGQTHVICRKLENGSKLWQTAFAGGSDPNCTPTIDPATGYIYGLTKKEGGTLVCINSEGKEVWKSNYAQDFGGKMMSSWGFSESPLIDGDRLICTPGSDSALIAALDKSTGKVIWKTRAPDSELGSAGKPGAGYGSIVISHAGGKKHYVQMVGRGLVGVSADDGKLLWNYNRIANKTANIPTPIISGDYVFGSSGYNDGGSALLKISASGSGLKATEVYYKDNRDLQNHHGGMILIDDHLYLGHGHNNGFPACINLQSGDLKWEIGRGPGSGSAAITYAEGHLYFRYENHVMALFKANPEKLELVGQFQIDSSNGKSWPHPVIHQGKLYLRDQDELLCYDIAR